MHKKPVRTIGSFLILSLSFSFLMPEILFAVEQKKHSSQEEWGYLKIITQYHGLAVKIDGNLIGFSPLEILIFLLFACALLEPT